MSLLVYTGFVKTSGRELYNLKDDPTEIFNLAGEDTGRVTEMENNYINVQRRFEAESE